MTAITEEVSAILAANNSEMDVVELAQVVRRSLRVELREVQMTMKEMRSEGTISIFGKRVSSKG